MINDENTSWEQIASKLHHEMNKKELAEFDRLLLTEKHLNEFNSVKQINERLNEVGYILCFAVMSSVTVTCSLSIDTTVPFVIF